MDTIRRCALSDRPLDVPGLLAAVADDAAGGQALFVGVVRDHDNGAAVTRLDYEAHPSAEPSLRAVADQVAARPGVRAVAVEHRTGQLAVGDVAVVCAVSAGHRGDAFDACRELIDTVKERVPIWKRQHLADGTAEWVGCS